MVFCTLFLASGLPCLLLGVERWRGQMALSHWKSQKAHAREVIEPERIWPRPTAQSLVFSNELHEAINQLPRGLSRYAGQMAGIVAQQPGLARPGSQQAAPAVTYSARNDPPATWQDLTEQVRLAQPALAAIRNALANPPPDAGYDIIQGLEDNRSLPNLVNVRRAAQALAAAATCDLRNGNLEAAKDNLVALGSFSKLYSEDPTLVSYMIRIAVLGLGVDVGWDALQAQGWTDVQLAQLEQAFDWDSLLAQMPRSFEAERAMRFSALHWFESHSYKDWLERFEPIYQSFGKKPPRSPEAIARNYYRDWVFHPLWRFAWADQEKVLYLQDHQRELDYLREASRTGSWKAVRAPLQALQTDYLPPSASWRFYLSLPLVEQISEIIGGTPETNKYPYTVFTRAWSTSMKNLTLCHLLRTAICLKRYELKNHKWPASLAQLVPEFIDRVPQDFMDGTSLRYRIRPDGTWTLYSIGDDFEDDQGNPTPLKTESSRPSVWDGRDWVWP